MRLVLDLLRHGEAAASSPDGDAGRPLTPRGADAIGRLARHLAREGRPWDRVFTSPLRRARETAEIVLRPYAATSANGSGPAPEVLDALIPDAEPSDVVRALRALGADQGRVLLVGHMPLLGDLWAHVCGPFAGDLRPGHLVRINVRGPLGPSSGVRLRGFDPEALDP